MIKVSRVTSYIPINISQIKFIEMIRYSYSLSLSFFLLYLFLFTLLLIFTHFLRVHYYVTNSQQHKIAYAYEGGSSQRDTEASPNGVSLSLRISFLHLREKRKNRWRLAVLVFSVSRISPGIFPHLLHCLCATLLTIINSCS